MKSKLLVTLGFCCVAGLADAATSSTQGMASIQEKGNLILDNIPSVDTPLTTRLDDYLNSRGASFVDWLPDGSLLIATRFGDVDQLHRVDEPRRWRWATRA